MASVENVLKNNVNLADYGPGLVAVFGMFTLMPLIPLSALLFPIRTNIEMYQLAEPAELAKRLLEP